MSERISEYELIDELGAGGIGTVYRARDTRTGATVALKVLHPHLAADPDYRHRFELEVHLAMGLESPHIVHVLDYGQDGDRHFLVMEYVEGDSLAQILKGAAQLPPDVALSIAAQVAQALDQADLQGMVHGDVKPGNILIAGDGTAKVSDFGLARALREVTGTQRSLFRATPHYAAPELVSGPPDIRSDIYSLGIVLYQMLAGRVPFEADTPAAITRLHATAQPPPLGIMVAPGVESILDRCLAKDPRDRFQDPGQLLEALRAEALASARPEGAGPPGRVPPLSRSAGHGRWRWLYGGIGVVAVSAAVIAALLVFVVGGGGSDGAAVAPPTATRTPAPPALTSTRDPTAVSTAERSPTISPTPKPAGATPTRPAATATRTPTPKPSTPKPQSPTPTPRLSTPRPSPEPEALGRPPDLRDTSSAAG